MQIALAIGLGGFGISEYSVGADPRAVAAADFDRDGIEDLVIASHGASKVNVFRGFPGGSFGPTSSVFTAQAPLVVVTADFDADGNPDFATANDLSNTVSLARGRGDLTFFAAIGYSASAAPRDLAVADMDEDGLPDLVVAHENSERSITWMRNLGEIDGAVVFVAPVKLATGFLASCVRAADINGDGHLDIVAGDLSYDSVRVFFGLGDGGVSNGPALSGTAQPRGLTVKDLDTDGDIDIAAPQSGNAQISIFRNEGTGVFAAPQALDTGAGPFASLAEDVDGDERLDLLVLRSNGEGLAFLEGTTSSGFGFANPVAIPSGVASLDINGDFLPDLLVTDAATGKLLVMENQLAPWIDLGGAVAGMQGPITLTAEGTPSAGSTVSLTASGARLTETGILVAGLSKVSIPFQGGALVPTPTVMLPVSPGTSLIFTWPDGLAPGSSVYLQAWFGAFAPAGASGSAALRAIAQIP